MGSATVGRIGYESRFDYTAIGSVVNLAARLRVSAVDREILMDAAVAEAVSGKRAQGLHRAWNNADDIWNCPCHGSVFEWDGTVIPGRL
ncbi:hypothetical protein AA309_07235 [Microvirga vignae]|uniref:Guanylate cyclase domain-containing protein n=1 Tax=Microvirga vignae TaxID=1225564 RepID=A0A0H1RF56_9HYPH|nr:hypothetical protein AA309_07235 [Microvirga vignae]